MRKNKAGKKSSTCINSIFLYYGNSTVSSCALVLSPRQKINIVNKFFLSLAFTATHSVSLLRSLCLLTQSTLSYLNNCIINGISNWSIIFLPYFCFDFSSSFTHSLSLLFIRSYLSSFSLSLFYAHNLSQYYSFHKYIHLFD